MYLYYIEVLVILWFTWFLNIWSSITTDACFLGLSLSAIIIALQQQKTDNMLGRRFEQGWTLQIITISLVL